MECVFAYERELVQRDTEAMEGVRIKYFLEAFLKTMCLVREKKYNSSPLLVSRVNLTS